MLTPSAGEPAGQDDHRKVGRQDRLLAMAVSTRKKLLYSLLAMVLTGVLVEVVLRCIYFQLKATSPLAVQATLETLKQRASRQAAADVIERFKDTRQPTWRAFFGEQGTALRGQFEQQYEQEFGRLVESCQEIGSTLLVLYIPSTDPQSPDHCSEAPCRIFFERITSEHGVPLVDLTEALRKYPWQDVTLLPEDDHFSRLGNRVVARELAKSLGPLQGKRCQVTYNGQPAVCADLDPGVSRQWDLLSDLPFLVTTNAQGFRGKQDVEIPRKGQRILLLGDSCTFGIHLPNAHTYAALLAEQEPGLEVLNAGVVGYTIVQEVELFQERASAVAPDVIVLQVLDNDIYGMFFFTRSWFDRKGRQYEASEAEREFLEELGLGELSDW
jgi:lysophospholipase L1-like esterase